MTRARRPRVPRELPPEQGFAWLAAEQRKQATRAGNHAKSGHVSKAEEAQLEREAKSADIAERLAWAIANRDRAGEVGVTFNDHTKRYDLEIGDDDGLPRLVQRDVTPSSE